MVDYIKLEKMKPYIIMLSLIVLVFISMNNLSHKNQSVQNTPTGKELIHNPGGNKQILRQENSCIDHSTAGTESENENLNAFGTSDYLSGKHLFGISIM